MERAHGDSGTPIAGWKLEGTTAGTRAAFATDEVFFGTLLQEMVIESPAQLQASAFYQTGIEPEICLVLSREIAPRKRSYDPWELVEFVANAHLSIEVPNSCIRDAVAAGLPTCKSRSKDAAGRAELERVPHDPNRFCDTMGLAPAERRGHSPDVHKKWADRKP